MDQCVLAAATDVWATMLGWNLTAPAVAEAKGPPTSFPLLAINGCVGFAGNLTGSVFLSCETHLGERMARIILGDSGGLTAREVSDVVGELTNMLAGGCVSRLRDQGFTLAMSIPNVIRGVSIQATSRDVTFLIRRRFFLAGGTESVQVTVAGKTD
ncbi:MAG TPA: chemotaxis protein CheX [Methylomirabilota bacterium]|nr:chemotaxis protein CheX [Methylomirabilota bacterium]